MTTEEVQKLNHGLYRIFWTEDAGGGMSLASVGSLHDGSRWFAPTNWTSATSVKVIGSSHEAWRNVERVEKIELIPQEEDVSPCHTVVKS